MKNILNKISIIYLFALIVFINIGTTLISMQYIHYLEFSKCLFIFGLLAFAIYFCYKVLLNEKIKLKDIFIILLLICGFLSYLYAYKKDIALNGTTGRYEGLKTLFSYYAIFLLASTVEEKWQKRIMYTLTGFGIAQILIGTCQTLQINNILGYDRSQNFSATFSLASGTLGNPDFYSIFILLIFMYLYSLVLNLDSKKILIILLATILGYGLIIGNTTSCILATLICIIVTLIRKINKNNFKKVGIGILSMSIILILFLGILNNLVDKRLSRTIKRNIDEITNVFKEGVDDSTGNYRIYIWKESLNKLPEYYKTGIGIDNFGYINNGSYLCSPTECFDKAHNDYLQILITEGMPTLIIYLSFISYVIINYKHKNKNAHNKGLFYGIMAYLIQAFFNISVIQTAPIFYMMMGFICSKEESL